MLFEIKKITHIRMLWVLVIILLVANIMLLNEYDIRQVYSDDTNGYTKEEYTDFLAQIPEQTKSLSEQLAYQNHDTFLYRNLMKIEKDYSDLTGNGFVKGKYTAWLKYASYPYQIIFIIFAAFMVTFQMFPAERKKGFFLLLKSTRRGHTWLYVQRTAALSVYLSVFSLVSDIMNIVFIRYRYGSFHTSALIQSSSTFRNCPYDITIGQAMLAMVVIHMALTIFCIFFIQMLFSVFKRNEISLAIYAAFFATEYLLSDRIEISGSMSGLVAVNPFYQSVGLTIFGNYLNVDIIGFPVSQMVAGTVLTIMFCIAFLAIGSMAFSYSFQTEGESLFEKLIKRFRKHLSWLYRTDKIAVFEFRKIMIHEKKILILIIFAIIVIGFSRKVMSPIIFSKAEDAEYHRLANRVQGLVTDNKLKFIKNERKELDNMLDEASSLGNSSEDRAKAQYLEYEYQSRNGGLSRLELQRDALLEKTGQKKYFFDEAALSAQFFDIDADLLLFLISGIVLAVTVSGIEGADTGNGMFSLLSTTDAGYGLIRKKKQKVIFLISIIYFLLWNIPDFLSYFRIDHGKNLLAPLSQLTSLFIQIKITELAFFILLAAIRLGLYMVLTAVFLKCTVWFKSPAMCGVVGTLMVMMITLVMKLLNLDIIVIMLIVMQR